MKANSESELADLVLDDANPSADPLLCLEASRLIEALGSSALPINPPALLRSKLLVDIAREPRLIPFVQLAHDAVWREMGVPGFTFRMLFSDQAIGRTTLLVKLEPGTQIPLHHHDGVEEVFMLEGDLCATDGSVLHAGDYQRNEKGSLHQTQWSVSGCIALMIAPTSLIASATEQPRD